MKQTINKNPTNEQEQKRNWRNLGSPIIEETPSGVVDGANKDFFTASRPIAGTLQVFAGTTALALMRVAASAYTTSIDAATKKFKVSFTVAPAVGTFLVFDYRT